MVEVIISKEAKAYLYKKGASTLNISVEKIPCGCIRPREVPEIKFGTPKNIREYEKLSKNGLTFYLAKSMNIPERKIEINLGTKGNKNKLYPTGIEYFNGMGSYCELPQK
ncbi:MAG: hypothetical protein MI975_14165 [Cytophagales bacterium]|nr:hypothetical protein [Cytophagales bacterium]